MSLVTAVLAEGTTIPTCVTFSYDDLYPFREGSSPAHFYLRPRGWLISLRNGAMFKAQS